MLDVDGQRRHLAAALRGRHLGLGRCQRWNVEDLRDALPPLAFHEQHLLALGRKSQRERSRDGRLTGPTLTRHEMKPCLPGRFRPVITLRLF